MALADRAPRRDIAMIRDKLIKDMTLPPMGQADTLEFRKQIAQSVVSWLTILVLEGRRYQNRLHRMSVDLDHSALLRRLLEGKPPLPVPPPSSYGYPWYELVDNGFAEPTDVRVRSSEELSINQFPWRIRECRGPLEWLVSYDRDPRVWRVWSIGVRPGLGGDSAIGQMWRIELHAPDQDTSGGAPPA